MMSDDGAEERDHQNEDELPGEGEEEPGRRNQRGADEQEIAQIVLRREQTDAERQQRRAEQRGGCDHADLKRRVAGGGKIGRQDDDREAVAEAAQRPRRVEQGDVGRDGARLRCRESRHRASLTPERGDATGLRRRDGREGWAGSNAAMHVSISFKQGARQRLAAGS